MNKKKISTLIVVAILVVQSTAFASDFTIKDNSGIIHSYSMVDIATNASIATDYKSQLSKVIVDKPENVYIDLNNDGIAITLADALTRQAGTTLAIYEATHQSIKLSDLATTIAVTNSAVSSVSTINITKPVGADYTLPTTVIATLADSTTKSLGVVWDKVASTTTVGTYTYTGKLKMVNGVVNTNSVTVTVNLTVQTGESVIITDSTDITSKFTDANFKASICTLIGKTSSDPIFYSDVKNVKSLLLYSDGIGSLNGIEYFTALTSLFCYDNQLTTLDVSKNTALTKLDCSINELTTLVVSKNTALTTLSCYSNQLTTLDVSNNTALTKLDCSINQLTTLDLSKNTALTTLSCLDNQLTTLYSTKDTWYPSDYKTQYTDSTHTAIANNLVITIKN